MKYLFVKLIPDKKVIFSQKAVFQSGWHCHRINTHCYYFCKTSSTEAINIKPLSSQCRSWENIEIPKEFPPTQKSEDDLYLSHFWFLHEILFSISAKPSLEIKTRENSSFHLLKRNLLKHFKLGSYFKVQYTATHHTQFYIDLKNKRNFKYCYILLYMCSDMFLYINVYMFVHVEVREKLGSLFYFGAFHLVF